MFSLAKRIAFSKVCRLEIPQEETFAARPEIVSGD